MDLIQLMKSIKDGYIPNENDRIDCTKVAHDILNGNSNQYYIGTLITICNMIYNNYSNLLPMIDDSLYDQIMVYCKNNNIEVPVGSCTIKKNITDISDEEIPVNRLDSHGDDKLEVVRRVKNMNDMNYYKTLTTNITPIRSTDFYVNHDDTLVSKKSRNVSHNYNLCGTLDKCNYVLNVDAKNDGVEENPNIGIFERDFIGKHITQGLIDPNNIQIIASLKYDGVSIEAEIRGNRIISACTRGDTINNEASDLTPIFEDYIFHRAAGVISDPFGIKFECIITNENMYRLYQEFGKSYVNARNAVIGLLGGLDARKYRDYLTLVPLESSLTNVDRMTELEFLNKYYTKGIDMRHTLISGNYLTVMYKLRKFVQEAEELRSFMPFMYDGVVVEYYDDNIRKSLGYRQKSIPKYSVAIKFNPLRRTSTFLYYTYSIGQNGMVVPMAHFKPVEFFGAIHDKTTAHSYKRFKELNLHPGDLVNLQLKNDVIVYLTKSDNQQENPNPPEEFPTHCPSCGTPLIYTQGTAICTNFHCPERCIARVSNMLKKLNIKDFSTETIRALNIHSLHDLLSVTPDRAVSTLGDINGMKFIQRITDLKMTKFPDYRLIGSLGFTNIAMETWRLILSKVSLPDILIQNDEFIDSLINIRGIGPSTVETIKTERKLLLQDLHDMIYILQWELSLQQEDQEDRLKIVMTGFRDTNLQSLANSKGYRCVDSSVTNDTAMVVVPYRGFISSKVNRAFSILSKKVGNSVNWDNVDQYNDYTPNLMDQGQIYNFLNK